MPKVSALLAGALLPFAFAPYQYASLAILSPALLLWNLQGANSKFAALTRGFCYGLGCFGLGTSWVFISIHRFGNTPVFLAFFITLVFVALLALYFAGFAILFYTNYHRLAKDSWKMCFFFPSLWVLMEWLRSVLGTGFPWLILGSSQTDTPLSGFAPLGSAYLVSWLLCFLAALLVYTLQNLNRGRAQRIRLALTLGLMGAGLYGLGYALQHHAWTQPNPHQYHVALIQGNMRPDEKFAHDPSTQKTEEGFERYYRLSHRLNQADIIVWPENAISIPHPWSQDILDFLDQHAKKQQQTWALGIPKLTDNEAYYNTLMTLGLNQNEYHKTHLVPFGEYVPFEKILRGLIDFFDLPMSRFTANTTAADPIFLKHWIAAPFICYEIAYANTVRKASKNAHVLLNISEDGWFGDSLGPHQHLQIARMRAIETGKPILRAATSGISAFINEKGMVIAQTPQFVMTTLSHHCSGCEGQTPWVRLGLWPLLMGCLSVCLAGLFPYSFCPITRRL